MAGQARKSLANEKCLFCLSDQNNELAYGAKKRLENVVTHYYCLLLSSNMEQKGEDTDGLLGFMLPDIQKELSRGSRLACTYCKKPGATINCQRSKCKKMFHLPCGIKEGSLHQFFGQFKSFCSDHWPAQAKIPPKILREMLEGPPTTCAICYEDVPQQPSTATLWAPCCRKGAWFHRDCVQTLANSAGYFFKCPLCNNKDEFREAMLNYGIYIPEQDASWETVPNAYEELLHRHDQCDHPHCCNPKGRRNDEKYTRWELVLCDLCGSQGVHIKCGALDWENPEWECAGCRAMLDEAETRRTANDTNVPVDTDSGPSSPPPPSASPCPSLLLTSAAAIPTPTNSRSVSPPCLVQADKQTPLPQEIQRVTPPPVLPVQQYTPPLLARGQRLYESPPKFSTASTSKSPVMQTAMPQATAVQGQRARRGVIRYGGNPVQPQSSKTVADEDVIEILTDSDDDVQIVDDSCHRGPVAVTELVTTDGSKIQVVQVTAKESTTVVVERDVNVSNAQRLYMSSSVTVTALSPNRENDDDDVLIVDCDLPQGSKYSAGVMRSNGQLRPSASRLNRRLQMSQHRTSTVVTLSPNTPKPVPMSAVGMSPSSRRKIAGQRVVAATATQTPQRFAPRSFASNSDASAALSAQRKPTPTQDLPRNATHNQQMLNTTYKTEQYNVGDAYQSIQTASPSYRNYTHVKKSPAQSPKRSRLATLGPEQFNAYPQVALNAANYDSFSIEGSDRRPPFPPSYEEATSQIAIHRASNSSHGSVMEANASTSYQNVLYGSVGNYVTTAGGAAGASVTPDSAGLVLQPGTTYVAVNGNPSSQIQGFVVTSQSTVIPTSYVMNAQSVQPTSVGGTCSQYDCCFQRSNAAGSNAPGSNTASAKDHAAANDSAAAEAPATAVSVAGSADHESPAATGDEAPGSPTEPPRNRSVHNRLIACRSFTFKVNGPKCINVIVDSTATHIALTKPRKSKLIPVLPTVPFVPMSGKTVTGTSRARKAMSTSADGPASSVDVPGKASVGKQQPASRSRKRKDYYFYEIQPSASESEDCYKYTLSDKTVMNTRSKEFLTTVRSTRSTVSLKEYNFVKGSKNHVPLFKPSKSVAKPSISAKIEKLDTGFASCSAEAQVNDEPSSAFDEGDSGSAEKKPQQASLAVSNMKICHPSRNNGKLVSPSFSVAGLSASGASSSASGASSSTSGARSATSGSGTTSFRKVVGKTKKNKISAGQTWITDFMSTSTKKRAKLEKEDVGNTSSSAANEDSNCSSWTKQSSQLSSAGMKEPSPTGTLAKVVPVDANRTQKATTIRLKFHGKRRFSPDSQTTSSESLDLLLGSGKTVCKAMEASDYSEDTLDEGNINEEDDATFIKKTIMKYNIIDKMSTIKAKTLTARKFLPSSRTEQLQREMMKRLAFS